MFLHHDIRTVTIFMGDLKATHEGIIINFHFIKIANNDVFANFFDSSDLTASKLKLNPKISPWF